MSPTKASAEPPFIMDDVKLLLNDLTSPESGVKFVPPARSNPATIQGNINPLAVTWTWATLAARQALIVTQDDVGKYGLQSVTNSLFRLTSVNPSVWQPVASNTSATWVWSNLQERQAQVVAAIDVGRIGIQTDTATMYQLTGATPPVWQPIPNPTATSSPFELFGGSDDRKPEEECGRLSRRHAQSGGSLWPEPFRRQPLASDTHETDHSVV